MNNNYILARWRDAITDPPPGGWIGLNIMANGARYYGACGYMPGDQWLDITDRPGVPREAVQAAVDEINMEMTGPEDEWPIRILNYHTGLLPTEEE